jgi:hypothetical protein
MKRSETPLRSWPGSLPQPSPRAYPDGMPDSSDIRRLRVPQDVWDLYTEIVGDGGRSADLKAYIEWRVDNPTTPLPGRRRGPVKRVRKSADAPDKA